MANGDKIKDQIDFMNKLLKLHQDISLIKQSQALTEKDINYMKDEISDLKKFIEGYIEKSDVCHEAFRKSIKSLNDEQIEIKTKIGLIGGLGIIGNIIAGAIGFRK